MSKPRIFNPKFLDTLKGRAEKSSIRQVCSELGLCYGSILKAAHEQSHPILELLRKYPPRKK